jgi:hypothetical protein
MGEFAGNGVLRSIMVPFGRNNALGSFGFVERRTDHLGNETVVWQANKRIGRSNRSKLSISSREIRAPVPPWGSYPPQI